MGVGAGMAQIIGQNMAQAQQQGQQQQPEAQAQPDPSTVLKQLKQMLTDGLISQEQYDAKAKEVLDRM